MSGIEQPQIYFVMQFVSLFSIVALPLLFQNFEWISRILSQGVAGIISLVWCDTVKWIGGIQLIIT